MSEANKNDVVDLVAEIPLFKGLPPEQLRDIASIVQDLTVSRNSLVFSEGDEADGFYVVIKGRVKIFKLSFDGKEQIIHIFGEDEPFGEVPVFEGGKYPANAQSLENSRLFLFPRKAFVALVKRNPFVALNMLAILSKRLRGMAHMIEDLSLKEAPARLAAYLLLMNKRSEEPDQVKLDISKTQLASLIGATPETVSRILAKLAQQGMIETQGPVILITDKSSLEALAVEGRFAF